MPITHPVSFTFVVFILFAFNIVWFFLNAAKHERLLTFSDKIGGAYSTLRYAVANHLSLISVEDEAIIVSELNELQKDLVNII